MGELDRGAIFSSYNLTTIAVLGDVNRELEIRFSILKQKAGSIFLATGFKICLCFLIFMKEIIKERITKCQIKLIYAFV